ncbi:hypothetical protein SKAU_G00351510 [Synaphobranchus kaupii]|uniref:Reverse transcriptase domain-containing protein n=1 Tax=Synaphobranchus kaupii TaxID=118154 RepID=A0A9Q1EKQ3_SYNKA|nr:hypothetical protein SKAU_G00351510 [Synaphobranchus kaupii]
MGGVSHALRLFIKELGKELVMPYMKRCMEGSTHLQKHITEAMGRCGLKNPNPATTQPQEKVGHGQVKRKRCKICPAVNDRKNRSCTDQITTLRIILEWNSPFYVNFFDYEKAFDSVDRQIWKLLRHYGVPEKITNIRNSYEGIDWVMKTSTAQKRNGIQWTQLDDLDIADDLALLSHTQ